MMTAETLKISCFVCILKQCLFRVFIQNFIIRKEFEFIFFAAAAKNISKFNDTLIIMNSCDVVRGEALPILFLSY